MSRLTVKSILLSTIWPIIVCVRLSLKGMLLTIVCVPMSRGGCVEQSNSAATVAVSRDTSL